MQMLKVNKSTILFLSLALSNLLSGCSTLNPSNSISTQTHAVISQAERQGFVPALYDTSLVTYAVWEKNNQDSHNKTIGTATNYQDTHINNWDSHNKHLQENNQDIHVFIEGDGNSWKKRDQVSDNPTPKNPLSLKLAMQDVAANVIYIARPCQYHFDKEKCKSRYWSNARYSEEVIQSTNEVLSQIKTRHPHAHFLLIGFSGGGNIAALLSARRKDVSGLITVAGNLDHDALNEYHHVSPMLNSLNAIHYAKELKNIPQRHYAGSKDKIVPAWLATKYKQELNSPCVSMEVIKGNTHHQGWEEQWPQFLKEALPCQQNNATKIS